MKTKIFTISFFLLAILFFGCDEVKPKQERSSIVDSVEGLTFAETENYYVLAENGLRMREEPELSSEKVATIKYGSKVQVIPTDGHDIKPVNGLFGSMVKGIQGRDNGYVFDGYLSSIPVPTVGQREKDYVKSLQAKGYPAKYDEIDIDDGMELEEILTLPTRSLQEAFLIGQRLEFLDFDFDLPSSSSRELTYRSNGETKVIPIRTDDYDLDMSFMLEDMESNYWFREVGFQFDGREIIFIKLDVAYEGGSWSCTIGKEGENYVFRKLSIAD